MGAHSRLAKFGAKVEAETCRHEWIDDEVYQDMQDLLDAVRDAVDKAWALENLCQEREMGKKRF